MDGLLEKANEVFVVGVAVCIVRGAVANMVIKQGKRLLVKTERDQAIVGHYAAQAVGKGHASASVLDCGEGKCRVFGSVPQTQTA